jgi:hypothetical protein
MAPIASVMPAAARTSCSSKTPARKPRPSADAVTVSP